MRHADVGAGESARRSARRRTAAWCASLAVVAVAGCQPGGVACPAVGYSSELTVELSESWAALQDPAVDVACPDDPSCVPDRPVRDGDVWRAVLYSWPEQLAVTVTDAGAVVAEVTVEPAWRVVDRPHGPRCGGPGGAHVVLDLPE
jgi:hypothetical protein